MEYESCHNRIDFRVLKSQSEIVHGKMMVVTSSSTTNMVLLVVYSIHQVGLNVSLQEETLLVFSMVLLLKLTLKMIAVVVLKEDPTESVLEDVPVEDDDLGKDVLGGVLDEVVLEDVLAEGDPVDVPGRYS